MKKRAIIYIRVSTDEQAEKGYSIRYQLERLQKFCELQEIEIVAVFNEDYSAKTFDRPEFTKLLEQVRKKQIQADIILFTKWDRFSRNAGDAYMMINRLAKIGIEPQAMEQPLDLSIPENKIMLAVYLAAPEVENDRRALNVVVGMRRAKKEGRWMATAPKGYKNSRDEFNKKVITPSADAPLVKWIFEELATGIHNSVQVLQMARQKGFDCSKNNFWKLIRNPVYCGKIAVPLYKDDEATLVKGLHEPIIPEELFYQVQDVLDGRKRNVPTKNTKKDELPLRGFLICRKCNSLLTGSASKGNGGRYFYYHCKKGCNERIKAQQANDLFVKGLETLSFRKTAIDLYYIAVKDAFYGNEKDKTQQLVQIKKEIETNRERIQKAQTMMLDGQLEASDYRDIKSRYQPEIDRLSRKINEVNSFDPNYSKFIEQGFGLLRDLAGSFARADLQTKQQIIGSIFPEKLIFENNGYRTKKLLNSFARILTNNGLSNENKKGAEYIFSTQPLWVTPRGFEPPTNRTGICHSIQLNYGAKDHKFNRIY